MPDSKAIKILDISYFWKSQSRLGWLFILVKFKMASYVNSDTAVPSDFLLPHYSATFLVAHEFALQVVGRLILFFV